jgi:hypothetical protein
MIVLRMAFSYIPDTVEFSKCLETVNPQVALGSKAGKYASPRSKTDTPQYPSLSGRWEEIAAPAK